METRAAALLFFSIALASCAAGSMRWQKADADEAAVARDLSDCRKLAQSRYGPPGAVGSPFDPRFGPTGPSPAESQMQIADAVGRCMRGRGYDLAPAGN